MQEQNSMSSEVIFSDKWVCNLLTKKSFTPKVCKWNYAGALQYVCASDPLGQVPRVCNKFKIKV